MIYSICFPDLMFFPNASSFIDFTFPEDSEFCKEFQIAGLTVHVNQVQVQAMMEFLRIGLSLHQIERIVPAIQRVKHQLDLIPTLPHAQQVHLCMMIAYIYFTKLSYIAKNSWNYSLATDMGSSSDSHESFLDLRLKTFLGSFINAHVVMLAFQGQHTGEHICEKVRHSFIWVLSYSLK